MKFRVLMFVFALLAPATAGAEAPPLDSATIRAKNLAAAGPQPAAFRETLAFTINDRSGTETFVRRGADFRDTIETALSTTARGSYKGDQWFQNENGHTVIAQPDPGVASTDTFTTTVEHVLSPADVWVISTLNARGYGTRNSYDAASWLLVRSDQITAAGHVVTAYDSFATFGERHLAKHWHVHNEAARTESDYTITAYATDGISEDALTIPDNRRTLVEFPNGTTRVVLPAKFLRNGHVAIPVRIGERTYDYLLDTGSALITIDPGVAARLGLTIQAKSSNAANAGRIDTGTVVVPEMHVGALAMHDVHASAIPFVAQEDPSVQIVGLLGFDFICEMGITIDYEHQTVTAEKHDTYPVPENAIALPIRLGTQQPQITVTVNGAVAERMALDTGAVGATLLFDYFARRHPEALVDHDGIGAQSRPVSFNGVGGHFDTKPYAFETFQLGNFTFRDFVGYVVTSKSYGGSQDGVIGATLLRFFDVHLDYPNGMIYLVPNQRARREATH